MVGDTEQKHQKSYADDGHKSPGDAGRLGFDPDLVSRLSPAFRLETRGWTGDLSGSEWISNSSKWNLPGNRSKAESTKGRNTNSGTTAETPSQ